MHAAERPLSLQRSPFRAPIPMGQLKRFQRRATTWGAVVEIASESVKQFLFRAPLHSLHQRSFLLSRAGQNRTPIEVVEMLSDGSHPRYEGAVIELKYWHRAARIDVGERCLVMPARGNVDFDEFDLIGQALFSQGNANPQRICGR